MSANLHNTDSKPDADVTSQPASTSEHEKNFRIECHGTIYVVLLDCAAEDKKLTSAVVEAVTQRLIALVMRDKRNTANATGWSVLYDLSALQSVDSASIRAMSKFARWAKENGRQRTAYILPTGRYAERFELHSQAVGGLLAAYRSSGAKGAREVQGNEFRAVKSIQEGIDYLRQPAITMADETPPRYGESYARNRWSDTYRP